MPMDNVLHQPHGSQTQLEQRQLIQFESNLAACYETEYLLSLKMQEDVCQRRDSYDDPSEVQWSGSVGAMDSVHSGQTAAMECSVAALDSDTNVHGSVDHHSVAAQQSSVCPVVQEHSLLYQDSVCDMESGASEELTTHLDGPCRKRLRAEY